MISSFLLIEYHYRKTVLQNGFQKPITTPNDLAALVKQILSNTIIFLKNHLFQ